MCPTVVFGRFNYGTGSRSCSGSVWKSMGGFLQTGTGNRVLGFPLFTLNFVSSPSEGFVHAMHACFGQVEIGAGKRRKQNKTLLGRTDVCDVQ